ncbi:MAG: exodeoxyribonuclease V subunit beta [Thermodesulfobacteriota bacterium]|nr:exodeoxyribonuclease V subunit beta [Thermodesulfobacteriota bacterium]
MLENFKSFDAASASLNRGVNVVEASAGTGKTYAIAMLVLRFVAEFGVPVQELLVVSYTRAATEELRSRIRKRLVEARDVLTGGAEKSEDTALLACLDRLPDKGLALQHLELALLDMDRAAVFTIHGFCQRMLQEQALEAGQLFDMELTADISQVRNELVADFWRRTMYDLPVFHCSLFLERFSDPDELYKSVQAVGVEDIIEPDERMDHKQALLAVDEALEVLVRWWQKTSPALEPCFLEAIEQGMFKKDFSSAFDVWWQQCHAFFSGTTLSVPQNLAWLGRQGLKGELHGNRLRGDARKSAFLQDFPLADEKVELFLAACERAVLAMRIELALELQSGLRTRLNKKGRFSFDDLVVSLARALGGEQNKELQKVLAGRFQVALIDEFQDTDAAQYRIFSTLFGGSNTKHFLFLIGDPKQAVYKFRGADIHAYFQAREEADYHLGLGKNYRSNPLLVQAVNNLFLQKKDAFVNTHLPYNKVSAAKSPECWQLWQDEKVQSAMVYCSLLSPHENGVKRWTSGKIRERLQSCVVEEIRALLDNGLLVTDEGVKRRVSAGDIAILVRTNKQAEAFQEALALASVPSVVSSRKTVFETRECRDLLQVMEAVASPADLRRLRTAMSCKWFGLSGRELYELTQNEQIMEAWMERFHGYHRLWQEKGFLAMMNSLFVSESVFETLCTLPLAERQISNLMHLIELLQETESKENFGFVHTLQYLSSQMASTESREYAELRLESDEQAVKVVTMHAVKGLEYPIVFCPYLWYRASFLKKEKDCITYHDTQNRQVSDLGSPDFLTRREAALEEELAEEARLLYVAVTRASCRCYVFWADVSGVVSKDSALAWMLSLDDCQNIDDQTERIAELCADASVELRTVPPLVVDGRDYKEERLEKEVLQCRTSSRSLLPGEWLLTSYSALAGSGHSSGLYDSAEHISTEKESRIIYNLPFGAALGNVVHGMLEDFPFAMLAGAADYEDECLAQCRRFGVTADTGQLMALLRDVTRSPIIADNGKELFSLAGIEEQDVLKEMPFYFHLREESTERINELLAFSSVVQPIEERKLKGYLTGFVDLVCRHQGKYYIMDYKTNYIGDYFRDYSKDFLVAAMHDHNYGLQYWIYTLVLHGFLSNTIPGYEYEKNFGGVFYLFARGMSPEYPENGLFFDRPQFSVLEALQKCLGAG